MQKYDISGRQEHILSLLTASAASSASDLAQNLGVTVQTIRSDLRGLEEAGQIRRRHGVVQRLTLSENIGYQPRQMIARAEKDAIAAAVARLIPSGASLALGTGTTVEACARALAQHRGLRVFTNNLHVALAMRQSPEVSIEVAGGALRLRDMDFVGSEACEFFVRLRPDFSIFSVGGLSLTGDLLDYHMDEVRVRQAIGGCAAHRILVLDGGKLGRSATYAHGRHSQIETVVTSGAFPEHLRQEREIARRRLIVA